MSLSTALPLPLVHPDQVEDEAKIVRLKFYKSNPTKLVIYYILSFFSVGLIPLFCLWKISLKAFLKYVEASSEDAEYALVCNNDGILKQKTVKDKDLYINDVKQTCKSFSFRRYRYYFDQADGLYKPLQFSLQGKTYNMIHKDIGGGMPSLTVVSRRLTTYGMNSTDIPVKSYWKIFIKELLSPYYFFQLYACLFWGFAYDYYIYVALAAIAVVVLLVGHCYKTKSILVKVSEQAHYETEVRVYRPSEEDRDSLQTQVPQIISSKYLVPGDLIEIPYGKKLPCDIVLLSGTAVMNEGTLTGESAPVTKTSLPRSNKKFDLESASQHILFSSTECVETTKTELEPQIVGVVVRTGFLTVNGRFIRSIRYKKQEKPRLYRDTMKFMGIMAVIGIICFFTSLNPLIEMDEGPGGFVRTLMDFIIMLIPPFLPTYYSLGFLISTIRLRFQNVDTRSELKISLAGKVQAVCFNRTGTLTDTSLDLHGVKPVYRNNQGVSKFQQTIKNDFYESLSPSYTKSSNNLLLEVMATCHQHNPRGKTLAGEKLDQKLLEAIKWEVNNIEKHGAKYQTVRPKELHEYDDTSYYSSSELRIIKRFPESTKQQRTTVVSKDSKETNQRLHTKGEPEVIKKLCKSNSIPEDFHDVLNHYVNSGFRVLACATKLLEKQIKPSDNIAREFFEKDMEFVGFLMFENKVRESAPLAVAELSKADISALILTADSASAAVLTARLCGIIDEDQKVACATLTSDDKKLPLQRLKCTWMTRNFAEDQVDRTRPSPLNEVLETQVILKLQDTTERTGSIKDLDTQDMINFLESLKDDNRTVLVVTGEAFRYLREQLADYRDLYNDLVKKMRVFARVSPEDKAMVIKELQNKGNTVAMVGNGVSDCQALNAANISIAITDSEATLVSTFMSKTPNLLSVPRIISEGRATLVTSFHILKHMAVYCMAQAFCTVATYFYSSIFGNATYLYQDLLFNICLGLTLLLTKPTKTLSKEKPLEYLMSASVLLSVFGQAIIQGVSIAITMHVLHSQNWYITPLDFVPPADENEISAPGFVSDYDNTTLFLAGNVPFTVLALAFWKGKPFRMPFFRNFPFLVWFTVTGIISILLIIVRMPVLMEALEIQDFDPEGQFRWYLFSIIVVNCAVILIYEKIILKSAVLFFEKISRRPKSKAKNAKIVY